MKIEFTLLGRRIRMEVAVTDVTNPLRYNPRKRRRFAEQILRRVEEDDREFASLKLRRIVACRQIALESGLYDSVGFGLKDAKDFVEAAFTDNGNGPVR